MHARPRLLMRVISGGHAAATRREPPISLWGADMARVIKRSIVLTGHKTSVSLEDGFWVALKEIAQRQRMPVSALVARIDGTRAGNLSSAIRIFVLNDYRRSAGFAALPDASGRQRECDPPPLENR